MTTFAQSTIHSKLAKYINDNERFEKTNEDVNTGRVVKGVNT